MPTTRNATTRTLSVAAAAAVCALTVAGCGTEATVGAGGPPPGISTQATGKATGTPDTLTVTLGVQTRGADANGALAANAEKATALVDSLKSKGVDAKDIQTSGLSVQPTYGPDGTITGYQVGNQVTATVHDIGRSGELIDAAAAAAGDAVRVQQTSFSIADDGELREQARSRAVKQAQAQADQIASAAGVGLGAVRSITEMPAGGPTPMPGAAMSADRVPTPVEPGSQEVAVTVEVVYDVD
ncbi:SIMPL domain-containing protein [Rhodococcus sp. NPDC127528]|uniref:SIMPL domain-containing protein n=1 Tax=unclassified Rhodococcus (in: high G+C Gram-positive bacteria) TaxID=192944 RepID=UPI00362CCA70